MTKSFIKECIEVPCFAYQQRIHDRYIGVNRRSRPELQMQPQWHVPVGYFSFPTRGSNHLGQGADACAYSRQDPVSLLLD